MVDLSDALGDLKPSDILYVIIHRKSSGGDLIAYPIGAEFDEADDGIHISDPREDYSDISQILNKNQNTAYDLYVLSKIKIQHSKKDYPIAKILSTVGFVGLTHKKGDKNSTKKLVEEAPSSFPDIFDIDSTGPNQEIRKENTATEENDPSTKPLKPSKIPASHPKRDMTYLYYLNSKSADCYHQTKRCPGLRHRQGVLHFVEMERDGNVPDEVSHLRKCHHCC